MECIEYVRSNIDSIVGECTCMLDPVRVFEMARDEGRRRALLREERDVIASLDAVEIKCSSTQVRVQWSHAVAVGLLPRVLCVGRRLSRMVPWSRCCGGNRSLPTGLYSHSIPCCCSLYPRCVRVDTALVHTCVFVLDRVCAPQCNWSGT